jgi:hypothetical protein
MGSEPRPAWLIRQENGSLAEARTRAFLMDRFWVLERSADVEGADLIIQRRLTNRSLLDRTPPRLGFIQTKFYADSLTTQYVHREYVLDTQGAPRAEFFILCHTGTEDGIQAFLISAEEIFKNFRSTDEEHSKPNRFVLPGKDVFIQRFEIVDRKNALDQIERALRDADFERNRAFVAWALPSAQAEKLPILPMYEEQIENWWGDIPREFNRIKEKISGASWDLEDALSRFREMQESRDPERVLEIAEEIKDYWGNSISLPTDICDQDFRTVVHQHKKRYEQLSAEGLLGAHAAMRRSVMEKFIKDVAPKMPLPQNTVYELTVRFASSTLRDLNLTGRFEDVSSLWPEPMKDNFGEKTDMPDTNGILEHAPGLVRAFIAPGRYAYKQLIKREFVDTPGPWKDRLATVATYIATTVLEQVLLDRFGK